MISLAENKKDCCGCSACYNLCPQKAIEMIEDENGYIYPKINKDKCIECGLCKKRCIYHSNDKNLYEPIKTYAAISKDNEIIKKSSSGGIFASVAKRIIKEGGTVYGATLEKENGYFKIKHIRIDKEEDLYKLQGSKYVQSDVSQIYDPIKSDLINRKKVLFSGTPCQVDALRNYLKKEYENLLTIDIICHGVPNNKMFNEYIKILEHKEKKEIIDFNFRDKTKKNSLSYSYSYSYYKGGNLKKKIKPSFKSSYYQLFLDSVIYRESCYNCPYATKQRVGDITIGDYWKIEEEHPEFIRKQNIDTRKGVSCIIVNTNKGQNMMLDLLEDIITLESRFDKIERHNAQLNHPSTIKKERKEILNLYNMKGYEGVNKYYFRKNSIKNIIKEFWYKLPTKLRNRIR